MSRFSKFDFDSYEQEKLSTTLGALGALGDNVVDLRKLLKYRKNFFVAKEMPNIRNSDNVIYLKQAKEKSHDQN